MLLSTGTGLAPFASLIKDPEVYDRYDQILLVHGCRQVSELGYGEELVAKLRDVDLSEFCNLCEGLNPEQVERIADDLEHAARNELEGEK